MNQISSYQKHTLLSEFKNYSPILQQYLAPVFEYTEICFFQYTRYTKEHLWQGICTHVDSFIHNIENEYFVAHFAEDNFDDYENGFFFLDDLPKNDREIRHVQELSQDFKVGNLFLITKRYDDYCDFFILGANPDKKMKNFYINNLGYLQKISSIIQKRIITDIGVKYPKIPIIKSSNLRNPFLVESNDDILSALQMYISNQTKWPYTIEKLTSREKQCFNLIIKGMTAKKIAQILQISPRTIESHINNIKAKFYLNSKKEIVDFFK